MFKQKFLASAAVLIYTTCFASMLWGADCERTKPSLLKHNLSDPGAMIDVNNIAMWVTSYGLFAANPNTGHNGLEYPKDSGKTLIYSAGPLVVGQMSGEIRTAGVMYSTEYRPGLILPGGYPDDPDLGKYIVYKINRGESVPQEVIELGGPSEVIGDQMLYTVFNDADPIPHTGVWQTEPIKLEAHLLVWGYAGSHEAFANTIFMQYEFINKNTLPLEQAYVGFYFDVDIGEAIDDFVGCDPMLNLGFGYNGEPVDDVYGQEVPCLGCDLLQGPLVLSIGDTARFPDGQVFPDHKNLGMTAFVRYI